MRTYLSYFSAHQVIGHLPATSNDLYFRLQEERRGVNPHGETFTRTVLQSLGIYSHPDILYSAIIPLLQRIEWQRRGIDPDSEDEVDNHCRRIGRLTPSTPP